MRLSDFKFKLPEELIAQFPSRFRDDARLLVLHAKTGEIEHKVVKDLATYFDEGDIVVANDTKVFPARLYAKKEKTNANIEVFLLRELQHENRYWDVLVDPARKIRIGNKLFFDEEEPDSSNIIWDYYSIYYDIKINKNSLSSKFRKIGNFEYLKNKDSNCVKLCNIPLNNNNLGTINLGGDCTFNFKSKINILYNIIAKDTEEKSIELKDKLMSLILGIQKMHHSPYNFSLIPVTGALNKAKGVSLDRFDKFIFRLQEYYNYNFSTNTFEDNIEYLHKSICNFSTLNNFFYIHDFLKAIGSINTYCDLFYPELTFGLYQSLIISGRKRIDSINCVIEYIELAIRFWEAKVKYYDKQTGKG